MNEEKQPLKKVFYKNSYSSNSFSAKHQADCMIQIFWNITVKKLSFSKVAGI